MLTKTLMVLKLVVRAIPRLLFNKYRALVFAKASGLAFVPGSYLSQIPRRHFHDLVTHCPILNSQIMRYCLLGILTGTRYTTLRKTKFILTIFMGVIGFDGDQEVNEACRALGVSLNPRENINCQRTIGSRGLIDRDVSPFLACGCGRGDD